MSSSLKPLGPKLPGGIPQDLDTRFKHLFALLEHLPTSIPSDISDDESTYHFYLDSDDVKQEGEMYAFNRRLEVAFQTHKLCGEKLRFRERGKRIQTLAVFCKQNIKKNTLPEARSHQTRWIERLITAAIDSGAKVPPKKRRVIDSDNDATGDASEPVVQRPKKVPKTSETVDLTQDEDDAPAPLRAAAPPLLPIPAPKPPRDVNTPAAPRPELQQRTLFHFGARKFTPAEIEAQRKRHAAEAKEKCLAAAERDQRQKVHAAEHKKELGRQRQQEWRDRKKAATVSTAKKAKAMILGTGKRTAAPDLNVAETSRPEGKKWKGQRNGTKNGVIQKRHSRVNWYHPFLFEPIDAIAPRVGWAPSMIVNHLQRQNPRVYARLHKGTVSKWISRHGHGWSKKTQENIKRRHTLAGSGRVGVLSRYPEIVAAIKTKLTDLRASGICVGRLLTRSIVIAIIQQMRPELLEKFKCSESYVSGFLQSVMDWSFRHGTRAAAHIPANVYEVCERTFFRIVHLINFYDIPPELIINMDQTGVMLMVANNKTFNPKGEHQVDIASRDEKRAYTLAVASTPSGNLLAFQQVWAGATKKSLPKDNAPGMAEAKRHGFHFAFAQSKKKTSHFSTLKTMKEYVYQILVPYILEQIELLKLDDDQKSIFFIDFYPVHTGGEFRAFVLSDFPNIILVYVPPNCTPVIQPADVGLQRPFKHHIKQAYLEWMVARHTEQLKNGLTPEQVKFTTSLPVLRDASVKPIVDLFNWAQGDSGKELIKRAWEKCAVGEYNFGSGCLTSKKSKAAYREYLRTHPDFRKEIEDKIGVGFDDLELAAANEADKVAAMGDNDVFTGDDDDTDVPLHRVIQETLQLDIAPADLPSTDTFCVHSDAVVVMENGSLQGGGDVENIWAYNDNGVAWTEGNLASETFDL